MSYLFGGRASKHLLSIVTKTFSPCSANLYPSNSSNNFTIKESELELSIYSKSLTK